MNFIKTKFFFSFVFLVSALLALGAVYWVGTQNDLKAIQILSYRKIFSYNLVVLDMSILFWVVTLKIYSL